jgi:hypothetical protein
MVAAEAGLRVAYYITIVLGKHASKLTVQYNCILADKRYKIDHDGASGLR